MEYGHTFLSISKPWLNEPTIQLTLYYIVVYKYNWQLPIRHQISYNNNNNQYNSAHAPVRGAAPP